MTNIRPPWPLYDIDVSLPKEIEIPRLTNYVVKRIEGIVKSLKTTDSKVSDV